MLSAWARFLHAIRLEVIIAGVRYAQTFPKAAIEPNLTHTFLWDGLDAEPPQVSRRLHFVERMEPGTTKPVCTGGAGASGPDGAEAPTRARLAVGGDPIGRGEDGVLGCFASTSACILRRCYVTAAATPADGRGCRPPR